ncbi:MAG: ankyrin repeat domain-containing protein [Granulosicoccus sp.]
MISPSSPLAVLFASLIVSASSDAFAVDRNQTPRHSYQQVKLRSASKLSWISAISSDDTEKLASLLSENDSRLLLSITAGNGKSALMVAAKKGDLKLAKSLVRAGADVNEITDTQGTPFMFAILGGHQHVAQWLLNQGADINTVGSNGWTALTIAAAKGQVRLLQWLITEGAHSQVRDVYRFTPLLRAVDNGYVEAAAVLLSLVETDVNAQDEYDNTALHHAVSSGNLPMVSLLLEHRADPHIANRDGISPFDIARTLTSKSQSILRALGTGELITD